MTSLAHSALFRNPADHRVQRQAAFQALAEQDIQPRLVAQLEQQGGKLRAVWRSADNSGDHPGDRSTMSRADLEDSRYEPWSGEDTMESYMNDETSEERSIRVQARFEALYEDSKFRANRRDRNSLRKAQAERPASSKANKVFDESAFEAEYNSDVRSRRQRQAEREARRQFALAQKKDKEIEGCTFKPKLVARSPAQREAVVLQKKLAEVATRLSGSQKPFQEQLRKIQEEDDATEQQLRRECEEAMTKAQEQNQANVKQFLATDTGRRALHERAAAYTEANPGIEQDRAELEAHTDIVQSNEEQLKTRLLNAFREKRHMARQRWQIRRLQVVHELIKLEGEYADAVGNAASAATAAKSLIKDFDPNLVAKVKTQPWYIVARATAAQARERSGTAGVAHGGPGAGSAGTPTASEPKSLLSVPSPQHAAFSDGAGKFVPAPRLIAPKDKPPPRK